MFPLAQTKTEKTRRECHSRLAVEIGIAERSNGRIEIIIAHETIQLQ